ncbi:MAG: hypothetical protein IPK58_17870 [Acidobacteria bacterium]|nr:hypothetical protein [Acidobacteriota bacterium]
MMIYKINNWTKLGLILSLMFSVFSLVAMAQDTPNKQADSEAETTDPSTKPLLVEQVIILTFPKHPYVGIDYLLETLPGTKETEAAKAEDRKNRIEGFDAALKVNKKLNLEKSYSAAFTLTELKELSNFFYAWEGQQALQYLEQIRRAELITRNGGKLKYTEAEKAEYDKFVATPIGKRFITAYLDDAIAYEQSKANAVRSKIPNADGSAIYEPANLNELFNKFVTENYKK